MQSGIRPPEQCLSTGPISYRYLCVYKTLSYSHFCPASLLILTKNKPYNSVGGFFFLKCLFVPQLLKITPQSFNLTLISMYYIPYFPNSLCVLFPIDLPRMTPKARAEEGAESSTSVPWGADNSPGQSLLPAGVTVPGNNSSYTQEPH